MLREEAGATAHSDRVTFAAEVGLSRPGLLSRLIRRRSGVTDGSSACSAVQRPTVPSSLGCWDARPSALSLLHSFLEEAMGLESVV